MLKKENLSICLAIALGIFVLFACQTKTVESEESKNSANPTPTPAFKKSDNTELITIAAVGDTMLGSTSINDTFLPPNDGADILKEATPILTKADIAFANLEGPLLDGGSTSKCPPKSTRCFAFRMPTRYGKFFKDAGFDILNLANNHASDFGEAGRASTKKTLEDLGIKHSGSDQTDIAYLDVKGKKIAFVSFTHNSISLNLNDLENSRRVVAELKKKVDIVVVSMHAGAEGETAQRVLGQTEIFAGETRGNVRAFARTVVDAGADLVLGHGPHVLRGMEIYKDRLIVYSMGNFTTYGMFNLKGMQSLSGIFEIKIGADGKFSSGKINAGKQFGRGGFVLDKTGEAIKKVRELSQADFPQSAPKISDDGTFTK